MKDINNSRRKFLIGTGALTVGSVLPGGLLSQYALALPVEKNTYSRMSNIAKIDSAAPFSSMPNEGKTVLRQFATDFLKNRIEKSYSEVIGKVLGKTLLGTISPGFVIIFDLIFPGNAPTWDGIKAEIDKRIKEALEQYEFEQIQKKIHAVLDAYSLRMESVEANNSNIADKSAWDLGSPAEWEPLINMCLEIKNYFYNNNKFTRHYEAAQLVSDFNFIYFLSLNSRLQCFEPGDNIGGTLALMREFITGQYDYLGKLANTAYFDIHGEKDIGLTDIGTTGFGQWRTVNIYPYTNPGNTSTSLSGYDQWDSIRWTHDMIRERIRLYLLMNTQIMNMCEAQTVMMNGFKKFDGTILSFNASKMLTNFISNTYCKEMNRLQQLTPYSDGGGYSGLTLPAYQTYYESGNYNFKLNDGFCTIYGDDGNGLVDYGPGDYPNIINQNNQSPGLNMKYIHVRRGFRVFLFPEANYKGNVFATPRVTDFSELGNYTPSFKVKSMKIRIEPEFWFGDIKEKTIGRLPKLGRSSDDVLNNQIPDIIIAAKP